MVKSTTFQFIIMKNNLLIHLLLPLKSKKQQKVTQKWHILASLVSPVRVDKLGFDWLGLTDCQHNLHTT